MQHPKSIKVYGRVFKVKYRKPGDLLKSKGALGLYHNYDTLIEVDLGQENHEIADTVLHELFHALIHIDGPRLSIKTEEAYVGCLASGLVQVLRDNPKLITWLAAHIHPAFHKALTESESPSPSDAGSDPGLQLELSNDAEAKHRQDTSRDQP
jgi:hypothetical protein